MKTTSKKLTSATLGLTALLGATSFVGAANVIVNSSFTNDSGTAITSDGSASIRNISGWGNTHLYRHLYNGTQGPKLNLVNGDAADGTYKGINNTSQTVNLTTTLSSSELANIAAGNGTFEFTSSMAGYINDGNIVATRLRFFSSTDGSGTALSTFSLDRGVTTNQINTADKIVNPGGPNNIISETDTDYWGLYSSTSAIPTGAQSLMVDFVAGTGHTASGGLDWYTDDVAVDITAIPEPSSTALIGLAGLGFILRRRRA